MSRDVIYVVCHVRRLCISCLCFPVVVICVCIFIVIVTCVFVLVDCYVYVLYICFGLSKCHAVFCMYYVALCHCVSFVL